MTFALAIFAVLSFVAITILWRGFPWQRLLHDEIGGLGSFAVPILSRGRLAQLFGEELFVAPPSWKVSAWFIDPVNGLDQNDGLTAATPVKSFNGGIVSRWGTTSPVLAQDTTITWLNDAPLNDSDPVVVTPIMVSAILVLQGLLNSNTLVASGVLAGTVAKNRATGQLLTATLAASTATRMLVKNTTVGKESFAFVFEAAGAKWALSQPITAFTVPAPEISTVSEVDTWADGDTYEIYALTKVNLSRVAPVMVAPPQPNFPCVVQVYHLDGETVDGSPATSNFTITDDVSIIESSANSAVIDNALGDDLVRTLGNCAFMSGVVGLPSSGTDTRFMGGIVSNAASSLGCAAPWGFDYDAILDATGQPDFGLGSTGVQPGFVIPAMGAVYIRDVMSPTGDLAIFRSDVTPGNHAVVWGPGSFDLKWRARVIYNGLTSNAVATFKQAGALAINGSLNANPWDPITGTWQPQIAITPAALDAAYGVAGFGGNAVDPTGGCIKSASSF